jgi:hypothetical protein
MATVQLQVDLWKLLQEAQEMRDIVKSGVRDKIRQPSVDC